MNAIATKVQIGTAACAIAAAAALTPVVVAQAAPAVPAPQALGGAAGLGSAVISPECAEVDSLNCASLPAANSSPGISASSSGSGTLFQNRLIWFGTPNPNPPALTPVFSFQPLNLLPGFIRPVFSWFADINYEACIGGLTLHIGPYGTVSGGYSRGCA
jgi:hypothetical protein